MLFVDILYWCTVFGVVTYVIVWFGAVIASFVAFFSPDAWTLDEKDPVSEKSLKKPLRKLEQREVVVVGRSGTPVFPVIAQTSRRLSVAGLQNNKPGLEYKDHSQWELIHVPEGDDSTYHPTIQSRWGLLSPLYVFRKLTLVLTGRHVVRVFVPFYVTGFFALFEPITMDFMRARSKASLPTTRAGFKTIDDLGGLSPLYVVSDVTDHLLEQFPLRIVTGTLPTTSGYSLRIDLTLVLKVVNVASLVGWKDWASQITSVVSNAIAQVVRRSDIDNAYAAKDVGSNTLVQSEVEKALNAKTVTVGNNTVSILGLLGLQLITLPTLNDIIPADKETEQEMKQVMSISITGQKEAEAIRLKAKAQVDGVSGATPEQLQHLAAITGAARAGRIDMIHGGGGGALNLAELLAALKRNSTGGGAP